MNTINKLNIAKWILALRSGKFAQTTEALKDNEGYCCLGVACETSGLGKWNGPAEPYADGQVFLTDTGLEATSVLPWPVVEWLGVADCNPFVIDEITAVTANDTEKKSFEEIAASLEKTYLDGAKAKDIVAKAEVEAAAWLTLAEAVDTIQGRHFLCIELLSPSASAVAAIPTDVRSAMRSYIWLEVEDNDGVAYLGRDNMTLDEEREGRVVACLMFAAMTEAGDLSL